MVGNRLMLSTQPLCRPDIPSSINKGSLNLIVMMVSWGNKIFKLYTTFAVSMIVLVYKCCQTNYDLVSADYYNEELAYQQLIDGSARLAEGGNSIQLKQVEQGVLISYKDFVKAGDVSGECHFYYAPDASFDLKIPLIIGKD